MLSLILFSVFVVYSTNAASASLITKCTTDDHKCLKQTAQTAIPIIAAGIPEYEMERLDPFFMKSLDASSKGLKLYLKDVTGRGLKGCIAKKIERDPVKNKIFVKMQCTVDFSGKYEMKGHLLILPIEGKGDAHVVLRKLFITVEADIADYIGPDGENHWTVKKWDHSYDLKDKSTLELENLFNGNELLGRAARELIATSSNEIVKEVGPPIVKAVVKEIIRNVENLFKHVPTKELTL